LSLMLHPDCDLSSFFFFFSSRRRHTRLVSDWSSDVCSSDLERRAADARAKARHPLAGLALLRGVEVAARGLLQLRDPVHGPGAEIGRASCRERVEISGVGGSLKKRERGVGRAEQWYDGAGRR